MAEWADRGHAMRRREGLPSSHLGASGASAGQQNPTLDDHYQHAAAMDSVRVAQGEGPIDSPLETMSDQQHAHAPEAGGSRHGARYTVEASTAFTADPTVGPTQRSGRIVPTNAGMAGSFQDSIQASEY